MFVLFLSSQTIIRKVSFNLFQGELEIEIQEKKREYPLLLCYIAIALYLFEAWISQFRNFLHIGQFFQSQAQ